MSRVCVFVDGSNFHRRCKEVLGRTDVDFEDLAALLVTPDRTLVRTYYYSAFLPSRAVHGRRREQQQRLLSALRRTPYLELRLGRMVPREVVCTACGDREVRQQEKGVDIRLGVDMVMAAHRDLYDVAVLVTGDGDLVEAVRAVKDLGKHVELATFSAGRSDELAAAADVVRELSAEVLAPLVGRDRQPRAVTLEPAGVATDTPAAASVSSDAGLRAVTLPSSPVGPGEHVA